MKFLCLSVFLAIARGFYACTAAALALNCNPERDYLMKSNGADEIRSRKPICPMQQLSCCCPLWQPVCKACSNTGKREILLWFIPPSSVTSWNQANNNLSPSFARLDEALLCTTAIARKKYQLEFDSSGRSSASDLPGSLTSPHHLQLHISSLFLPVEN